MTQYQEISRFSKGEELANALSHLIAALLSVAALVMMIIRSVNLESGLHIVSSVIFGTSLILLYFSSAMTHYLQQGRLKNVFFSLDKVAIYLLIAGTYTPIALLTIRGGLGWTIFGIEWASALAGSYLVLKNPVKFEKGVNTLSVITYAIMGWLIIIAIVPVIKTLPVMGWMLIFMGGAFYTIGIFFYKKGKFRYHHLVWHLLVIAGSASHYLTVFLFVLRPQ